MGSGLKAALAGLFTLAVFCLALSACSSPPQRNPSAVEAERAAAARTITEVATRVAVSKAGARVCREITVGISESDWVRGTVVETGADRIRVRIDEPGKFPQTLDGISVVRGATFWDTPLNWRPCV